MPGIVPSLPVGPPAGAAEPPAQRSSSAQGPSKTEAPDTAPDIGLHAGAAAASGSEKHQASGCDGTVESPPVSAAGDELPVGDDGVKNTPLEAEPSGFLTTPTAMTKSKSKRKKNRSKASTEQRGPTALPPSRGTGTEGQLRAHTPYSLGTPPSRLELEMAEHHKSCRVLRRPAHDPGRAQGGKGSVLAVSLSLISLRLLFGPVGHALTSGSPALVPSTSRSLP